MKSAINEVKKNKNEVINLAVKENNHLKSNNNTEKTNLLRSTRESPFDLFLNAAIKIKNPLQKGIVFIKLACGSFNKIHLIYLSVVVLFISVLLINLFTKKCEENSDKNFQIPTENLDISR